MDRTLVTAMLISTPLTVLLVNPLAHLGFGRLPGDIVFQDSTMSVMIPLVSATIVFLTIYGGLRLIQDWPRRGA